MGTKSVSMSALAIMRSLKGMQRTTNKSQVQNALCGADHNRIRYTAPMNRLKLLGYARNYNAADGRSMTMPVRRSGGALFAPSLRALRVQFPVASKTLTATSFLLAGLSGGPTAKAQRRLLNSPPPKAAESMSTSELQQQRLLNDVAHAVVNLEANGDRTIDAIENSQITLTLDSMQDSSGLGVICINGDKALNVFAQSLARELGLNGKVHEATCIGVGRGDDPFVIKFRLHYESGPVDFVEENPPELRFIVEKPVDDELDGDTVNQDEPQAMLFEPSTQPALLNPRRSQASHTVMKLPQGWTPLKLPDPTHADSAFGTFDSSVSFADGRLTVDRKLVLKRDKVEAAELPALRGWEESFEQGYIVTLRTTLFYPYGDPSARTEDQKKAASLIFEAKRDIHAQAFAKAEAALQQAEAIDPGHETLHETRGELAIERGDEVTALAEYRKELESFPDALIEMSSIAQAQFKLGDRDGAIVTFQRWMEADPNSNFAAIHLMEIYHDMGRSDLAVLVGDEAMNTLTKDAKRGIYFLLTYGRVQMQAGQSRNAESTLKALLDLTVDDRIVNDAAYELAEQGLSLDRAEQSLREALAEFDPDNPARSVSTTYAESSAQRTHLLLSTWDTLGWILYKKGAVQEAEGYVRAAWRSQQDIAICRHLGAILTAEEKPVDAMNVYTLGLAVFSGGNAAGLAKDPDAIAVRAALAHLKQKGHAPTVTDPKAALLALRTLDIGLAAKPHGPEPYTVTLTASEMVSNTPDRDREEESNVVTDYKLLASYFPPDSKAALTRTGTIQCSKRCTLVFTP